MEKTLAYISIATAGCFVLSSAYMGCFMIAAGHPELMRYVTFSDVVNSAFAILVPVAFTWTAMLTLNTRVSRSLGLADEPKTPRGAKINSLVIEVLFYSCLALCLVIFARKHPIGAVVFAIFLVIYFSGLARFARSMATRLPDKVLISAIVYVTALFGAVGTGAIYGTYVRDAGPQVVITDTGQVNARSVLPLERGLIVFLPEGYRVINWNSVKSISSPAEP